MQLQEGGEGGPAGAAGACPGSDRVGGLSVENPSKPHRPGPGPPSPRAGDNDGDVGTLARAKAAADAHLRRVPGLVAHAAQLGGVVEVRMFTVGAAAASPAQEHGALLACATHRRAARARRSPRRGTTGRLVTSEDYMKMKIRFNYSAACPRLRKRRQSALGFAFVQDR